MTSFTTHCVVLGNQPSEGYCHCYNKVSTTLKYTLVFIIILFCSITDVSARARYYRQGRSVNRFGLHGMYPLSTSKQTFGCTMSTNYFAGDVEMPGNMIIKRFGNGQGATASDGNKFSNNIGANISFFYTNQFSKMFAFKPQISVGYLHGYCNFLRDSKNHEGITNHFERSFNSVALCYSFGFEFYPSDQCLFYLYAGVEGCTSFISRNINGYLSATNPDMNLHDKLCATTPVLPIGLGYKWLVRNYIMGVQMVWHPALIDGPKSSMDGWPAEYMYNGIKYYPTKESANKWSDSYLEIGFSIGGLLGY